jgi:hypothetical protein
MTTIFLSFRNGDGDWAAKLIRDTLAARFGKRSIFLSSDSIKLAERFPDVLIQKASTCDVLLALIGPDWLNGTDVDGSPRLFADDDWVRREVATALAAGRPVAAVRLDGASRLMPDDLPADIRELASHQDTKLDRRTFDGDIARLEEQLMEIAPGLTPKPTAGAVTVKSEIEIEDGEDVHATGADLPATDRPVKVDHRMKMRKGVGITSTGLQMGEPGVKKADPA